MGGFWIFKVYRYIYVFTVGIGIAPIRWGIPIRRLYCRYGIAPCPKVDFLFAYIAILHTYAEIDIERLYRRTI